MDCKIAGRPSLIGALILVAIWFVFLFGSQLGSNRGGICKIFKVEMWESIPVATEFATIAALAINAGS